MTEKQRLKQLKKDKKRKKKKKKFRSSDEDSSDSKSSGEEKKKKRSLVPQLDNIPQRTMSSRRRGGETSEQMLMDSIGLSGGMSSVGGSNAEE